MKVELIGRVLIAILFFHLIVQFVSGVLLVIAVDVAGKLHNRVGQLVNVVLDIMTFLLVDSVGDTCVSLLLLGHVVLRLQVGF